MRTFAPGADGYDLAVNFGGLRYDMFFGPRPTRGRPPTTPPVAVWGVDECGCPSCASEGWYAASPLCRYWRSLCELCDGCRTHTVQYEPGGPLRRVPCQGCREEWHRDLVWFRWALRDPAAAAADLRSRRM